MKILIIGMGEIGKAVKEVVSKHHKEVFTKDAEFLESFKVDVLHICYPHTRHFLPITNDYIANYKPELTIIHTTTPVGTVELFSKSIQQITIPCHIAHAPIRGQHSSLTKGIQEYPLFVGAETSEALEKTCKYLNDMAIKTYSVMPSCATELIKLLSLTQYGVNIEFARYAKQCCDKFNMPYELFNDYLKTQNEYLSYVSGEYIGKNHQRFVLEPPQGKIGGHCVLQGMRKLNDEVPEEFISCLIKGNDELAE